MPIPQFFRITRRSMRSAAWTAVAFACAGAANVAMVPSHRPRSYEPDRPAMARQELRYLRSAVERFKRDNGRYPSVAEGLAALHDRPSWAKTGHGPYAWHASPFDPWGPAYVYRISSGNGATAFELFSAGPDGKPDTADDIE
ncbi:MAG TPA: type II secretion system protein GspG [Humisphaera sp.]|jgi:general secretion pathway protein G|nr:type II secretion system protein GspG [Humisphaera sp.]